MDSTIKRKQPWAVDKHLAALGAQFAKCAACPGTTGKIADGKMGCSRAGAAVVQVTPAQAQRCNGIKPVLTADAWPTKTTMAAIGQLSAA